MELYNVRRFSCQVLPPPPRSDDGEVLNFPMRESFYSQVGSASTRGEPRRHPSLRTASPAGAPSSARRRPRLTNPSERAWQQQRAGKSPTSDAVDAARTTTSSRDDVSISNASELEITDWVIQDEPGVYITVRELHRVRFRAECEAVVGREQAQYL
ncbi:hypothetical protein GUJ93_ZPchr0003g16614 [Zizania palustris]|uniref:BRX domain-containing protein n=1 Tax=Zizania palustris TaxID=103762 RepID=A0A8J5SK29_ZIZPA|nr:hypothetical protein GUJ93_ZPchr0003g16614 [Zizania palustris]